MKYSGKGRACPEEWINQNIVVQLAMLIPVPSSGLVGAVDDQPQVGFPEMHGQLLLDLEDAIVFATKGYPNGFTLLKGRIHGVSLAKDNTGGGTLLT